jgi:hypothetical protein
MPSRIVISSQAVGTDLRNRIGTDRSGSLEVISKPFSG